MAFNRELVSEVIKKVLEEKITTLINSKDMVDNICKEINNPFNFSVGLDHVIASTYTRSFSSSLGTHLQVASAEIAKIHGWEIVNDNIRMVNGILTPDNSKILIKANYSEETRKEIDLAMAYIGKSGRNNPLTSKYVIDKKRDIEDVVLNVRGKPEERNADLVIARIQNDKKKVYVIEIKAGGDLDKGKAFNQRKELFELHAMLVDKFRNEIKNNEVDIESYFATLYNKTSLFSGAEKWVSSSVKKNFINEELLIGKDFWNFICNDENAYQEIVKIYSTYSYIIEEALEELKKKVKPIIKSNLNNSDDKTKDLYSEFMKRELK